MQKVLLGRGDVQGLGVDRSAGTEGVPSWVLGRVTEYLPYEGGRGGDVRRAVYGENGGCVGDDCGGETRWRRPGD